MNYWELITYDDEHIKVKPENVEFVQNKLSSGEGFIRTPDRSINVKMIKDFIETSKVYSDQKLLEEAHTAFKEPLYTEDGAVVARYVKKTVSAREFTKYYSHFPAYRRLETHDNSVTIAWRVPVDLITDDMEELTPDDERRLSTPVRPN